MIHGLLDAPANLSSVFLQDSRPHPAANGESSTPVDRGTQTSYMPQLPLLGAAQSAGSETHLFSHLPLHSQQPARSPYSMVPVGGIQLVPASVTAFVPLQAAPVQLTIPAVGVIHRNASPLPPPSSPPHPEGPMGSLVPCFPLGQSIQPVGLETLNLMGLTPQGLTLNAALGLQVLAPNPASQGAVQNQVSGLQIVNIALPAIIPSLSPLSALSPPQGGVEPQPEKTEVAVGAAPNVERQNPPQQHPAAATPWNRGEPAAIGRQKPVEEDNEASSDDEDRLVIAT